MVRKVLLVGGVVSSLLYLIGIDVLGLSDIRTTTTTRTRW